MLCCVQNWRKNDTEILSKTVLKSTPNLDRFCTQLGSILGGFWRSRWSQIRSKMPSRCNLFFILFLTSFFIDFYPNLAPTWPQLGPQIHPKTHPRAILEQKVKKIQPKWGPNSSLSTNMSPKTPKVAPGRPHGPHFHWFLIDFWWIFDTIFIDLRLIFYWFLIPC